MTVAKLRDGSELKVGDEVTTNFHLTCEGVIFVVSKLTPHDTCSSGCMVIVHMKDNPERKLIGSSGIGLDSNWFKLVK